MACLVLTADAAHAAFRDAHDNPPTGWTGKVFKLSQSYPATLPSAGTHPWTAFDFKKPAEAPKYMKAVLDYCLAGNTSSVMEDNFDDIGHNTVRKWYHAPWLDDGAAGREFIHGLTKERPSKIGELGPLQGSKRDNWAVGMYNARGGYTIGQVWKDPLHPDPRQAKFPLHTVTCKFLFTRTTVAEAPFLAGTLEWHADVNRSSGIGPRPTVRLLQVDVAVRVPFTASPIGWVFGTFQYEQSASASTRWQDHLVPVGIMWGNDVPNLIANHPPTTVWINSARGQKLHLGFRNQLLNGPIDNPHASCTACHGFAQINRINSPPDKLPRRPSDDNLTTAEIQSYFRDIKAQEPFSANYVSVDYSLQLQIGIANAVAHGGATLPAAVGSASTITHAAGAVPPQAATKIQKISRGN
ncbi:MAG TPA: hypothetical protein VJV75_11300 [Candidatus Polarisedimenticolia bacterium]|nr:hypothetical protein [Candidatus Polarisedimenticolia bacterium]